MIRKLTFIILLTFPITLSTFAQSQESEKYKRLRSKHQYREGYILDKDSVKINGLMKENFINEAAVYSRIEFVHKDGSKWSYGPADIKGFGFQVDKFTSDGESFYKIERIGKRVSLYSRIDGTHKISSDGISNRTLGTPLKPGQQGPNDPYYLYEKNENLFVRKQSEKTLIQVKKKKFIEVFADYFSDCEKLKVKIITKEVTHKDILTIVHEYNYCQ